MSLENFSFRLEQWTNIFHFWHLQKPDLPSRFGDKKGPNFKKGTTTRVLEHQSSYVKHGEKDRPCRYAQVRAFYPLTSSLSSTSIPPSLSSSICLWIMRRASRLNRSSSVKHGGLRELQGSKRGKTQQKILVTASLEYDDSKQDTECEFLYVHTYLTALSLQIIDRWQIFTKKWKERHPLFNRPHRRGWDS